MGTVDGGSDNSIERVHTGDVVQDWCSHMTVRELMAKLATAPPDAQVLISDNERGHCEELAVYRFDGARFPIAGGLCMGTATTDLDMRDLGDRPRTPATFVILSQFGEDGEEL
ncbi:hypothetical protein [Gordonia soli]|uniref:Uncharacterized protein n=1 Tax=Gordonia soli NBRC 108243 TaxID=1223545 RepID=M0QQQ9_9ACTN|nr:hypothetical protein [Gordonia soli]GAC71015.1 hypothetical protein GS4_47_00040 [Gordonia soli NBRC 108243]